MRRLDLTDYDFIIPSQEGMKPTHVNVKESLVNVLMHPSQRLNGTALLKRNILGEKILRAEGAIILEEADYEILKGAFDQVEGLGREDVQLVERVFNAPEVEFKPGDAITNKEV